MLIGRIGTESLCQGAVFNFNDAIDLLRLYVVDQQLLAFLWFASGERAG